VYAPLEPLAETIHVYAERAHNDVLQVAIEAGLPGIALIAWFTILYAVKAMRNFPIQPQRANGDDPVRSVLWIALSVPLLHAWVDYPMRTLAVSVLAGLLLACRGSVRQAGF
jgi:O-antigen ligase